MSTNPLRKHTSTLFASRGCDVDQALQEAAEVIDRLPKEDQAHAMTALMLVVNTAANAFDQARGPSPERIAVEEMVREMVNQQLAKSEDRLDQAIEDWMADNLSAKIDDELDDKINDWMNDNLESKMEGEALCEAIRDAFRNNLTLSIC